MELEKKDKKVARAIIEKGLQIEFGNGLNKAQEVIQDWKNKNVENREAYLSLFSTIYDFDKHIADRYDRMTGSRYFQIVLEQFADGIIGEEDLKDLSAEVFENLAEIKKRWGKEES